MATEAKSSVNVNLGQKSDTKICGVCGDRALGYNFGAVTCESCKAFFRRNALKNKEFRCPFNENCDIAILTRRFCQRCRLMKCLAIGMRKDFIMSEEVKEMKRQKIEENRARKRPLNTSLNPLKSEPNEESEHTVRAVSLLSSENSQASRDTSLEASPPPNKVCIQSNNDRLNKDNNNVIESSPSPTSAASLPSPSSPPDSAAVAGSKTLEMLCEQKSGINLSNANAITDAMVRSDLEKSLLKNFSKNRDMPLLSSLINNQRTEDRSSYSQLTSPTHSTSSVVSNQEESLSLDNQEWRRKKHMSYTTESGHRTASISDAAKEILQDVQRIPVAPNSIESILSEAIKLEFEAYSSLAKSHHNSRELNDAERAKLNELIVANKALHEPLDDDISELVGDDCRFKSNNDESPVLLDVINLTAIAIRRLIKTSKKINAFKNMCQEDQVALLKGGCTEMLILRSAMTYDPDKNSWKIPHSQERLNVKVDVLKEANGNIYEEHQRFLRTFDPAWRNDENIMLILSAITLFTPDRPRVVHHDVIKLEQNAYYYLLRRYLESIYQGCEARSTFLKLIQKIAELHRLNDEHVRVYLDVNPRDVEPLLIEIFDLKPH